MKYQIFALVFLTSCYVRVYDEGLKIIIEEFNYSIVTDDFEKAKSMLSRNTSILTSDNSFPAAFIENCKSFKFEIEFVSQDYTASRDTLYFYFKRKNNRNGRYYLFNDVTLVKENKNWKIAKYPFPDYVNY